MTSARERTALAVAVASAAVATVAVCLAVAGRLGSRPTEVVPGESLYREVFSAIDRDFAVEPDVERLVYGAMKGAVAELGDPFSKVLSPVEWERYRRESSGAESGVGFEVAAVGDRMFVAATSPDGPAAAAGVAAGSRILAVDGREVDPLGGVAALERSLRGPEGAPVLLTLAASDGADRRETKVVRAPYESPTVFERSVEGGVAYVRVSAFRSNTAAAFQSAVERSTRRGAKALVVDLRFNRGGAFEAATAIADMFLVDGVLCSVEGRRRSETFSAGTAAPFRGLPTALLVNGETASAAEVLAGALQDRCAAAIVGESTYGKGVVQEVRAFTTWAGGLKLTTARYSTPSGRRLDARGIGADERSGGRIRPDVAIVVEGVERAAMKRALERFHWDVGVRAAVEAAEASHGEPRFVDRVATAAIDVVAGVPPAASTPKK